MRARAHYLSCSLHKSDEDDELAGNLHRGDGAAQQEGGRKTTMMHACTCDWGEEVPFCG